MTPCPQNCHPRCTQRILTRGIKPRQQLRIWCVHLAKGWCANTEIYLLLFLFGMHYSTNDWLIVILSYSYTFMIYISISDKCEWNPFLHQRIMLRQGENPEKTRPQGSFALKREKEHCVADVWVPVVGNILGPRCFLQKGRIIMDGYTPCVYEDMYKLWFSYGCWHLLTPEMPFW